MINTIKKLLNIAFQSKTRFCVVFTNLARHIFKSKYSFMISFSDSTRKRCWDKSRFKYHIQDTKHGVMNNAISHSRFMDMSHFWVANIKACIRTMFIRFAFQLAVQFKNILFKIKLKFSHIWLSSLSFFKSLPRYEKILGINYLFK